ncbi:hypothetical protein L6164_001115 [Bauhinia variegata]|uniref:Uncharacterized protein n=1 Tax=Bauhinia variegata TaxID=167791 RepID=A0ACB9Q8L6_BAUVA|nr:hypothetical protein L6164_001115 [Bauhinia variegata]
MPNKLIELKYNSLKTNNSDLGLWYVSKLTWGLFKLVPIKGRKAFVLLQLDKVAPLLVDILDSKLQEVSSTST